MGWNHRVVRKTYPDGQVMIGIHEAFYDDNGLVWAITEDAVSPSVDETNAGETVEDLKKVIGWMLQACDHPVLDSNKIPEEGAESPSWSGDLEDTLDLDQLLRLDDEAATD